MAWMIPPVGTDRTSYDDHREMCGMAAAPGSTDDLDTELEQTDLRRDKAPACAVYSALYGEHTRSGIVTPLGANRPPIDDLETAA